MFKVFIYLYIFLESVLCKTWFWLFAQSGEVGAAVTIAVGIGSWAMSQSVTTEGEKGSSLHREWGAAQDHLAYLVLTGECHPCQERTVTTGSETALCLQPTLPVLFGQLPLWGGALAFFFFFFSDSLPFLYPDPTINAKGAPGTWGGSWPPLPKSSACPMWPH